MISMKSLNTTKTILLLVIESRSICFNAISLIRPTLNYLNYFEATIWLSHLYSWLILTSFKLGIIYQSLDEIVSAKFLAGLFVYIDNLLQFI